VAAIDIGKVGAKGCGLKFVPNLDVARDPLWKSASPQAVPQSPKRKRLRGKQSQAAASQESLAEEIMARNAKKKRKWMIPHKILREKADWNEAEANLLAGMTGRMRHIQEKIVLHNRRAEAESLHLVRVLNKNLKELPETLECTTCGCNAIRGRIQIFLKRKCGKPKGGGGKVRGREKARVQGRIETRKTWHQKLKAAGHIVDERKPSKKVNDADETLHCKRCLRTISWKRVSSMAAQPCEGDERRKRGPSSKILRLT
jgi:hypothetical protein